MRVPLPLARSYFAAQALAGALWWAAVFLSPEVRKATLGALEIPIVAALDIPLFVVASLLAAFGLRLAVWVVAIWTPLVTGGLVLYATLTTEAGWGVVLMTAATGATIAASFVVLTGRLPTELVLVGPFRFHLAKPAKAAEHLSRTGVQIVAFWGLFLFVIPLVVAFLEQRWGLSLVFPPAVLFAGIAILVLASALGIWSAVAMSTRGMGTPLPSEMANLLVTGGPYRYVRNPMALAGIVQGFAVGMILGSWLVMLYAICGSAVWNWIIRPLEEADLTARFGQDFTDYCNRVRCWIPRIR